MQVVRVIDIKGPDPNLNIQKSQIINHIKLSKDYFNISLGLNKTLLLQGARIGVPTHTPCNNKVQKYFNISLGL